MDDHATIVPSGSLDGWSTTLRSVPAEARMTPHKAVTVSLPILLFSAWVAWRDGTANGLGMALVGPALAVLAYMGTSFFQSTATRLAVRDGELTLTREGGLGTQAQLPVADILDFKVEQGLGRYNQTLELWTRTGPVPINVGGHPHGDAVALGERLKSAGAARRGEGQVASPEAVEAARKGKKKKRGRG